MGRIILYIMGKKVPNHQPDIVETTNWRVPKIGVPPNHPFS
jgi:hypothetical protein